MTIYELVIGLLETAEEYGGKCDVRISVAKQPDAKIPDQQYLIADARFIVAEEYDEGTVVSIRDWPY